MVRIHVLPADSSVEVTPIAQAVARVLGGAVARPFSRQWYTQGADATALASLSDAQVVDGTVPDALPGLSLLSEQGQFAADDGALVVLVVNSAAAAQVAWAQLRKAHATVGAVLQIGGGGTPESGSLYADSVHISEDVAAELARVASLPAPSKMTPNRFKAALVEMARRERKTIVLPEGGDERVLRAGAALQALDAVDLIILGDEDEIAANAQKLGLDLSRVTVAAPGIKKAADYAQILFAARKHKGMTIEGALELMGDVSYYATLMVAAGDADGMVSGAIHTTADTIRPALQIIRTKPGTRTVSGAFLMLMPDHVDVYADCAVNIDPTPAQLVDIATASADTARAFEIDPRVALISYSTGNSGTGPAVDKVKEAKSILEDADTDFAFDGPLQFDAAVDPQVARAKMPESKVAGHANVFVFSDLNQGNCTYKAVQRTSGAIAVGPILQGLNKPVNDLSRGCLVEDIINTVLITAVQAQN
ncbi:MAG: phosphate acetyltransferase [Actinomycetaceae bacterium]|nr:phosphate acetyltransferase [Actinomycetaceae bacterium]